LTYIAPENSDFDKVVLVVITQALNPSVDLIPPESPVTSQLQTRQLLVFHQSVDRRRVDSQIMRDFGERHHGLCFHNHYYSQMRVFIPHLLDQLRVVA
jgi:hypothetical protein